MVGYHLNLIGISSEMIQGYNQEKYAPPSTAASQAFDLDPLHCFKNVTIWSFRKKFPDDELLAPLFGLLVGHEPSTLTGCAFRGDPSKLKGYTCP